MTAAGDFTIAAADHDWEECQHRSRHLTKRLATRVWERFSKARQGMQEWESCTPWGSGLLPFNVLPGVVFPLAAVDSLPLMFITMLVVAALPLEVTFFVLPAVVVAVVVVVLVTVIIVRDGRPKSGRDDGDAWWFSLERRGHGQAAHKAHQDQFGFHTKKIVGSRRPDVSV